MGIHDLMAVAQREGIGEKKDIAWYLGFCAHHENLPLGRNPFRVDNVNEWSEWRKGWQHAAGFNPTP